MISTENLGKEDWPLAQPGSGTLLSKRQSRVLSEPWADEPWPLIETPAKTQIIISSALHIANEIAHINNAIIRGLNSIFLQAPYVSSPKDVIDLLFLIHCWSTWALSQHTMRQAQMFPGFEATLARPGALSSMMEGDYNFVAQLQQLAKYATQTSATPELYNGEDVQRMLADVAPSLHGYLMSQIPCLAKMGRLCGPTMSIEAETRAGRLMQVYLSCEAEASNTMDRFVVLPMMVRLRDTTFDGGNDWPRLSVLAGHAIADKLSLKYQGAWRFLPCDVWGKPRELAFLGRMHGNGTCAERQGPKLI